MLKKNLLYDNIYLKYSKHLFFINLLSFPYLNLKSVKHNASENNFTAVYACIKLDTASNQSRTATANTLHQKVHLSKDLYCFQFSYEFQ